MKLSLFAAAFAVVTLTGTAEATGLVQRQVVKQRIVQPVVRQRVVQQNVVQRVVQQNVVQKVVAAPIVSHVQVAPAVSYIQAQAVVAPPQLIVQPQVHAVQLQQGYSTQQFLTAPVTLAPSQALIHCP